LDNVPLLLIIKPKDVKEACNGDHPREADMVRCPVQIKSNNTKQNSFCCWLNGQVLESSDSI